MRVSKGSQHQIGPGVPPSEIGENNCENRRTGKRHKSDV